jgi:hypothetical protein
MLAMQISSRTLGLGLAAVALLSAGLVAQHGHGTHVPAAMKKDAVALLREGRETFRFETFGDEDFWGGQLKLHEAIAGATNGGVGTGLPPKTALGLGLKVDSEALTPALQHALASGSLDLMDPANTLVLLRANAVVGLTGFFDAQGNITSIGLQCAFCHSTVDDSFAPGIGRRLDGWPNRDLDVGAIVSLAPDLSAFATLLGVSQDDVRTVLKGWGPGKFDAELILDGKTQNATGGSAATLIPPAFGLAGVNLHTWTGWGSVPYWNAFVAVLEMHGKGNFFDSRLDDATQFPIAAANHFGHVVVPEDDDLVSEKLAGLHAYQLGLAAPPPPAGSFDPDAAARGDDLFNGKAQCSSCHVEPLFTEAGWNLHAGSEFGIDDFQADRAPDHKYRTSPLKGLWAHQKGGFFHDGRFATLDDVVSHYDQFFGLGLTASEKSDLVQYLLSL